MHLLAHSRGSDITLTALRELFLESRAARVDPLTYYKIRNLVVAAPELDLEVVRQRTGTEPMAPAVEQIRVYVSPDDRALAARSGTPTST